MVADFPDDMICGWCSNVFEACRGVPFLHHGLREAMVHCPKGGCCGGSLWDAVDDEGDLREDAIGILRRLGHGGHPYLRGLPGATKADKAAPPPPKAKHQRVTVPASDDGWEEL